VLLLTVYKTLTEYLVDRDVTVTPLGVRTVTVTLTVTVALVETVIMVATMKTVGALEQTDAISSLTDSVLVLTGVIDALVTVVQGGLTAATGIRGVDTNLALRAPVALPSRVQWRRLAATIVGAVDIPFGSAHRFVVTCANGGATWPVIARLPAVLGVTANHIRLVSDALVEHLRLPRAVAVDR